MDINKLTIGEARELARMFGGQAVSDLPEDPNGEIRIMILQRGWIFVGRVHLIGAEYHIQKAHCVRVWGTTEGIGELATKGPTSATKLDKSPTVIQHYSGVVCQIRCNQDKWGAICS